MATRRTRRIAICLALAAVGAAMVMGSCRVEDKPADAAWDALVAGHRHWLERPDYRMHYIDVGEGEPVVMIHGFADSTYCWFQNARPLLAAGYRLILVDLPGLGRSEIPPADLEMNPMVQGEEVIALIDHLGLDSFSLAGSSMGGSISLYIAHRTPDRVRRAIVLDPAAFWQRKQGFLAMIDIPGASSVMGRWAVEMALKDVYYDSSKVADTLVDEYARPLSKPGYARYLVRVLDEFDSPLAVEFSKRYGEIAVPLLIVWGDHDKWVPPEFGPRLQAMVPGSRLVVVADAGHLPHQERPELVNPLMLEFLGEGALSERFRAQCSSQ